MTKDELKKKTEETIDSFEYALSESVKIPVAFRSSLTSAEKALLRTFFMWYINKSDEEQRSDS